MKKPRKITKAQRQILAGCVAILDEYGDNRKPVTVNPLSWRDQVYAGAFSKAYCTYAKQMYALLDAGVLTRTDPQSSLAYINPERARAALETGVLS